MPRYNAIVYPFPQEKDIVGLTDLTDFSGVPLSMQVTFGGKEIYSTAHLENILCYPGQSLIIEKRDTSSKLNNNHERPTMIVKVEFPDLGMKIFPITLNTTVKELKMMIFKATRVRPPQQILNCLIGLSGTQMGLQDSESLHGCGIVDGSTVYMFERSDGGVKEGFVNWWKSNPGLNVVGACNDPSCPSNQQEFIMKSIKPICDLEYGAFTFTDKSLLDCPACAQRKLKPTNFFIKDARASIQYTLESNKEIFTVNFKTSKVPKHSGSEGNRMQLWESNKELKFKIIKITCCLLCQSPFHCSKCGLDIETVEKEKTFSCGHVFDERCFKKLSLENPSCIVCKAKELWFVEDALSDICDL